MDGLGTRRLEVLKGHLVGQGDVKPLECSGVKSSAPMSSTKAEVQRAFPRHRQEVLKWNGWGYKDSRFAIDDKGLTSFHGHRYAIGDVQMPGVVPWMAEEVGLELSQTSFSQPHPSPKELPAPIPCRDFVDEIRPFCADISDEPGDRLLHSHGHTCHELFALRTGKIGRLVDIVVWPANHSQVEAIVQAAVKHNVCIIPFGGGTNVSGAVECPASEKRPVVSLDMTDMDQILWIDEENLTAHIQAGIIGQDLERKLQDKGYTCGHEPDSLEFSTLGGWVATRSSGMKKNIYGNIEDIVVRVRMVTPQGTMERNFLGPRNSIGPDIHHFMLGSEGVLGVITEVTVRIRPVPPTRKYGSLVFATFESGVAFLREVAKQRCAPASIRLMDNFQFQMGQVIKPTPSLWASFIDQLKKIYLSKFKGIDLKEMAACTLLFEGTAEEVAVNEKRIYNIAASFGGIPGGEENGRRGYFLTFVIAYIRDLALDYSFLAESFETSVPWSRVVDLCENVKTRVKKECKDHGIATQPLIACRVTQTYDAGACIYFYLAFKYTGISDPIGAFDEIEAAAREEILSNGGSLSHHHGVGKLRKPWVQNAISPTGVSMLKAIKQQVDPQNIFGAGNLIPT
ncbi:hypothetical protein EMCRGX_G022133 [Ephydatia muelleri]|eukprot:Em0009g823a